MKRFAVSITFFILLILLPIVAELALWGLGSYLVVDDTKGKVVDAVVVLSGGTGEERLAEESFERAMSLNPRDADAMHNRAWFKCQRGEYDDADRLFEQAIATPQYRDLARSLMAQGICFARAGRMVPAEQKLLRAYEIDPTNPTTAYNLADVLYRRSELERARFYVRRINDNDELSNAQTLWLAARIENRAGNRNAVESFGRQLRARFPQSREAQAYDSGRFNE